MNTPKQATTLAEAFLTLEPGPLLTKEQLDAFYVEEVNAVRGQDRIEKFQKQLMRRAGVSHYKVHLIGHPGVGKSTELTRLSLAVAEKYRTVRFSAINDLNSAGFRPFDVPLVMAIRLIEEIDNSGTIGWLDEQILRRILSDILNWYAVTERVATEDVKTDVSAEAGIGPGPDTLWGKAVGLFARIKGEIRYASARSEKVTAYRISQISELVEHLNRLLDEANRALTKNESKEWLFIGEDFDKSGIATEALEALFVDKAHIFADLNAHLIFNIPITLAFSDKAPFLLLNCELLPDTPVYDRDHKPYAPGRDVVRAILDRRIASNLFDAGQQDRIVVASGGNLRDLFDMALAAAENADLRDDTDGVIRKPDVDYAISHKRTEYERRLGSGPFDKVVIDYSDKANLLVEVYNGVADVRVPNLVSHALLRARAVQDFNGEQWFGVHPLVVDILKMQKRLPPDAKGGTGGGTA